MNRNNTRTEGRATLPLKRCAIYTRKSSEIGLEQEFNSLDAQRESGEASIKSQAHEGWTVLPDRYDDGGFTGGNTDRPALRRLLADIEAGKIDVVLRLGPGAFQLGIDVRPSRDNEQRVGRKKRANG